MLHIHQNQLVNGNILTATNMNQNWIKKLFHKLLLLDTLEELSHHVQQDPTSPFCQTKQRKCPKKKNPTNTQRVRACKDYIRGCE